MLSLRAAIFASGVALYIVSGRTMTFWRTAAGSIAMGAGISAMHYIGMGAMRSTAMCHYDAPLAALSVALAVVISFVALRLANLAREDKKGFSWRKIASAVAMGLAIPIMHYTGMAATSYTSSGIVPDLSHSISITIFGISGISVVVVMILSLVVLTSIFDRRLSAQSLELESAEQRYRLLFERSLAGVLRTSQDGQIRNAISPVHGFSGTPIAMN
jgi:NO-binding membrane sensor protein with MHYT domain